MTLLYVLILVSLFMGLGVISQNLSLSKVVKESIHRTEGVYGNAQQFIATVSNGLDNRRKEFEGMSTELSSMQRSLRFLESRYVEGNNAEAGYQEKRVATGL